MLIVGGSFETGKPSKFVQKLADELVANGMPTIVRNGGYWEDLVEHAMDAVKHETVLWMPDVANERPKLVDEIKKRAPHALLITSKRNDGEKYSFGDLVARALKTRSNLMLEISKNGRQFSTTILDPLGNVFVEKTVEIDQVAAVLAQRIKDLQQGVRVKSVCRGDLLRVEVPDNAECFFEIVRTHAQTFHELIHGANPTRMMGNASFRCESGFPTFRDGNLMFVSKRDIDKRDIGIAGFVPVSLASEHVVEYYAIKGNEPKPSVDSPINLRLYNQLPHIRYMLHSHTYVEEAPFTANVLACGDLREAAEVMLLVNPGASFFAVNLRGHGSLVGASAPEMLRYVKYVARPVPELQTIENG